MPLAMVKVGETRTIVYFSADDKMKRHLNDMGFIVGETVEVVGENESGMILLVKGVRMALNRGLADKISVA